MEDAEMPNKTEMNCSDVQLILSRIDNMQEHFQGKFQNIEDKMGDIKTDVAVIKSKINDPQDGICVRLNAQDKKIGELKDSDTEQKTKLGLIITGISIAASAITTFIMKFLGGN